MNTKPSLGGIFPLLFFGAFAVMVVSNLEYFSKDVAFKIWSVGFLILLASLVIFFTDLFAPVNWWGILGGFGIIKGIVMALVFFFTKDIFTSLLVGLPFWLYGGILFLYWTKSLQPQQPESLP